MNVTFDRQVKDPHSQPAKAGELKALKLSVLKACGAGESIEPGVERGFASGTPGLDSQWL